MARSAVGSQTPKRSPRCAGARALARDPGALAEVIPLRRDPVRWSSQTLASSSDAHRSCGHPCLRKHLSLLHHGLRRLFLLVRRVAMLAEDALDDHT